jgi:SAM-dependent methyltransferase
MMATTVHRDQSNPPPDADEQMGAYSEAATSGLYDKLTGLSGKYDNVRRYWEDELTRRWIRPHLSELIERKSAEMRRLRIMDLGCGSGDGYELLRGVRRTDAGLTRRETWLLGDGAMEHYKGVELNEDLLTQARFIHGGNPKLEFVQGNFCEGLPVEEGERPYDLYLTSYGTFSHHNDDETLIQLLADIAKHTEDHCIIVGDWLGRYSYEWQELWVADHSELRNMDYVISYIYDEKEREARRDELAHIYLRLMTPEEVMACAAEASKRAGADIKLRAFHDRSIFTGRHSDTCEYNPHAQPMRTLVNRLHEINYRTDLTDLKIDYVPKPGFDFINSFFNEISMAWNTLVETTEEMLANFDQDEARIVPPPHIPDSYPPALKEMLGRMAAVVNGVGWLDVGLPRENIIEPQLGYELRNLVSRMQRGIGCSHGLVGIFEVDKT